MVVDTLAWRAEVRADSIREEFVFHERARFAEHYPEGFFGVDREGRPVYVQRPGNIDVEKLWEFTTLERAVSHHITQQERYVNVVGPAAGVAAGRDRMQSVVLIDMEGVGVSTLTGEVRAIMGRIMQIDQDFYPELMHKALIVNAPTAFRMIWALVKHLLDARTQAKIEVLPADHAEHLLRHIEPHHLMERYGGANPAPLHEEPGPWQDPEVLAEVERRRAARAAAAAARKGGAPAPAAEAEEEGAFEDAREEAAGAADA